MALVEVTLPFNIDPGEEWMNNYSVKPGDMAYYIRSVPGGSGGFETHNIGEEIVKIGRIKSIETENYTGGDKLIVRCLTNLSVTEYPVGQSDCNSQGCANKGDFIFFAKDRNVEESSLVGYYGQFKFINTSRQKAELFATSCEVSESSK